MNHVDHIFYINLDKRTDRRDEIEGEFKRMGITGERFSAIYHPPPKGIVGCTKSHLSVLLLAMERNYENVLILEDDFMFLKDIDEVNDAMAKLFSSKPTFDVCFLAYNLKKGVVEEHHPHLTRVHESVTASGYLVNRHYYEKLIHLYADAIPKLDKTMQHWNYANDQVWKSLQKTDRWYCFTDRVGRQRDGYSDNGSTFVTFHDDKDEYKSIGDASCKEKSVEKKGTEKQSSEISPSTTKNPETLPFRRSFRSISDGSVGPPPTPALMDKENNLDNTDKDGKTALMYACLSGHKDLVAMLLNAGADATNADVDGKTPLMVACRRGDKEIVELLMK